MFSIHHFGKVWTKEYVWITAPDSLSSTRPFCSSAIRCTSEVHAMSCIWELNVLGMKASEGETSDSSYDLFLAARYLFILWIIEICHLLRRKHCLSQKKTLSASLCILKLSLLKWILFQNKGNDFSPPQFDPLPFHHGLQRECSTLSSTTIQGKT